jgi:hypothetical protein
MAIENSQDIKGLPITIQCTWANCYTEPICDRGLCIRSYDRKELKRMGDTSGGIIGTLTGNYTVTEKGVVWVEANIKYSDRRNSGWFRESDIWHEKKGVDKNPNDPEPTTKNNWLGWLAVGASVLRLVIG